MLTKTLLWAGERGPLVTVDGQQGSWFRSVRQGDWCHRVGNAGAGRCDRGAHDVHGRQQAVYIIVNVGAAVSPSEIMALTLPWAPTHWRLLWCGRF